MENETLELLVRPKSPYSLQRLSVLLRAYHSRRNKSHLNSVSHTLEERRDSSNNKHAGNFTSRNGGFGDVEAVQITDMGDSTSCRKRTDVPSPPLSLSRKKMRGAEESDFTKTDSEKGLNFSFADAHGFDSTLINRLFGSGSGSEDVWSANTRQVLRKLLRAEAALAHVQMELRLPYTPIAPPFCDTRKDYISSLVQDPRYAEEIKKWPPDLQTAFLSPSGARDECFYQYFQPPGSLLSRPYISKGALASIFRTPSSLVDVLREGDVIHVPFNAGECEILHRHLETSPDRSPKSLALVAAALPGRTINDVVRYLCDLDSGVEREQELVIFRKDMLPRRLRQLPDIDHVESGSIYRAVSARQRGSNMLPGTAEAASLRHLYRDHMNLKCRLKIVTHDILDVRLDPGGSGRVLVGTSTPDPERDNPESAIIDTRKHVVMPLESSQHTNTVSFSEFSCSGRYAITASYDKTVKVWNPVDGSLMWSFAHSADTEGHEDKVVGLAAHSTQDNIVASCGVDKRVFLWHARDGVMMAECGPFKGGISDASWPGAVEVLAFGNGKQCDWLVGGTDADSRGGWLLVWDVESLSQVLALKGHKGDISSVDAARSGDAILSATTGDNIVLAWDLRSGECSQTFYTGQADINVASYSPCERYVQSAASNSTVLVFDRRWPSRAVQTLFINRDGHPDRPETMTKGVMASEWTNRRSLLITGGEDGCARVWDVRSGDPLLNSFRSHSEPIVSISIDQDDALFVTGGDDAVVCLYSLDSHIYHFRGDQTLPLAMRQDRG